MMDEVHNTGNYHVNNCMSEKEKNQIITGTVAKNIYVRNVIYI